MKKCLQMEDSFIFYFLFHSNELLYEIKNHVTCSIFLHFVWLQRWAIYLVCTAHLLTPPLAWSLIVWSGQYCLCPHLASITLLSTCCLPVSNWWYSWYAQPISIILTPACCLIVCSGNIVNYYFIRMKNAIIRQILQWHTHIHTAKWSPWQQLVPCMQTLVSCHQIHCCQKTS